MRRGDPWPLARRFAWRVRDQPEPSIPDYPAPKHADPTHAGSMQAGSMQAGPPPDDRWHAQGTRVVVRADRTGVSFPTYAQELVK